MSTFFQLDEQRLRGLETMLAESMPLSTIERGWDYYRREKVLSVQVMDGTAIYGTVRGTEIYAVTLDTDDFGFSTCTCSYNGHCKHMAAVFYSYNAYAGKSPDEVHNRLLYGAELVQVEPASEGGQNQEGTADSSEHWLEEMERLHGDVWRQCRHSLHPLQAVLSALKGLSKSWDEGLRRLHWMHAILFVIDQSERAYSATDSYSRYYYEMAFARMTEPWLNHYHELAAEIDPEKLSKAELAAVDNLVKIFHERDMDREQQLHRWETMYFSLWARLVEHKMWREKEETWLRRKLRAGSQSGHPHFFYPMALAYLAFAENRDEEAIELLSKTVFNRTALLASDCALQRLEEHDWNKLEGWISYLYSGLTIERKSRAFGPFLTMCRLADVQQPDNPAWQKYLISFLPFSYSALTEHWLERRKYEQWADLQLLLGIEPDEMDIQVVREIAKDAPRILYPLYHQAIEGSIRMRNRQGYKQAVKLMKKLERLYKAEKQADKWSRYVDGIVSKHQRLRALQEELWRGKIIT